MRDDEGVKVTKRVCVIEGDEAAPEVVRPTARASMLAYACLRSVPYARVEQVCGVDNHPDWDEVGKEAARFGATSAAIESWSVDAKAHVDA